MQRALHILVLLTLALMPVMQTVNGQGAPGCDCGSDCGCCAAIQPQASECAEFVQVALEQQAQVPEAPPSQFWPARALVASAEPQAPYIPPTLAHIRTVRFLI